MKSIHPELIPDAWLPPLLLLLLMNLSSGVEASEQVLCADAACCTIRCLLHAACSVQRCLLHAEFSLLAAKFLPLCCTFRCLLLAACYMQNAALFAACCKIPQRCCMLATTTERHRGGCVSPSGVDAVGSAGLYFRPSEDWCGKVVTTCDPSWTVLQTL